MFEGVLLAFVEDLVRRREVLSCKDIHLPREVLLGLYGLAKFCNFTRESVAVVDDSHFVELADRFILDAEKNIILSFSVVSSVGEVKCISLYVIFGNDSFGVFEDGSCR